MLQKLIFKFLGHFRYSSGPLQIGTILKDILNTRNHIRAHTYTSACAPLFVKQSVHQNLSQSVEQ